MSMKIKTTGNYKQTKKYLSTAIDIASLNTDDIQKIADKTVKKLADASPYDKIAEGWSYTIERDHKQVILYFNNSYVENGLNIALLVDKGHATSSGHWVSGKNYIDEPVRKAFEEIIEAMSHCCYFLDKYL